MSAMRLRLSILLFAVLLPVVVPIRAQEPPADPHAGHQMPETSPSPPAWMVMYDGALFAAFNRETGPRGGQETIAPNWLMGMASRTLGPGQLTLSGMVSLDPLTVGEDGYRELFQTGEAHDDRPNVDRQHPHDLLMQAAAAWRLPLGESTGLTLVGAPVGEASLGPAAFMHRRSAAENSVAPLGHHTLDSTHISMSVLAASIDRGPLTFESSVFHGREPDDNRWDLVDGGSPDSWSMRVWFEPSTDWSFQVSHGFLNEPEALHPGDVRRTTASASWQHERIDGFTAVTAAWGRNQESDESRHAVLVEGTSRHGRTTSFARFERLHVDSVLLENPGADLEGLDDFVDLAVLDALTGGLTIDVGRWHGVEVAAGGQLTGYRVPSVLVPEYGSSPVSFRVFVRVRPPAGMGRMWDMRMTRPLRH